MGFGILTSFGKNGQTCITKKSLALNLDSGKAFFMSFQLMKAS